MAASEYPKWSWSVAAISRRVFSSESDSSAARRRSSERYSIRRASFSASASIACFQSVLSMKITATSPFSGEKASA